MRAQVFCTISFSVLLALMSGCGQRDEPLPDLPKIPFEGLEQPVIEHLRAESDSVRASSDDGAANGRLAMALHTYRLYEAADIMYQRTQRLSPDSFEWAYLHGVVLQSMSRNDAAIRAYQTAEKIRPGYLPLLQRYADLMVGSGDSDSGRKIYEQLIAAKPDLATAHYGLGKVYAQDDEVAGAALEYEKAIEIKPDYGAAHYSLAEVLRQQGDAERASYHMALFEQHKDQVAEINDPFLARVRDLNRTQQGLTNTAVRYLQQRDPRSAARSYEQLLESYPDNYSAHTNLVGLYGDLGQPEKSMQHFEAARRLRPEDPTLYNNLGVARLRNKQLELAAESFAEAVRLDPDYARAWRNLGKTQQDLGRNGEALESYQRSVTLDPSDRQAQYFYGRLLMATGNPASAIAPLTAALEPEDEKTPHFMRLLAIAQATSGDTRNAMSNLERARTLAEKSGQTTLIVQINSDLEKIGASIGVAP